MSASSPTNSAASSIPAANGPSAKRGWSGRLTADRASSTTLNRRDGSVLQAVTLPLPDGNTLLSYLDVTDTTRVENALRERTEALEAAGRLKSEFLANVSYELRTPLTSITGYAEMLTNKTYAGELKPRQLDYASNILESAQAFTRLVDDILDLATIEAGYMELDTNPVDIHAMLQSVLNLQQAQARNLGLRLEFDCPATIGTVPGDERRLKQVMFSLVSNALKFTPAGGSVTVAARREAERVALVVSDTGIGVAAEDQARIFEKFERGNRANPAPGLALPWSKASSSCMAARSSCIPARAQARRSRAGSMPSCPSKTKAPAASRGSARSAKRWRLSSP